jgi:predicted peroxiredoxin
MEVNVISSRRSALAAVFSLGILGVAGATPAKAGPNDPLFINLTSDDTHRIDMALAFGSSQMKRGHPLTLFLNDKAVLAASKVNAEKFASQQKTIAELLATGANFCPMCMKHCSVNENGLLAGLKVGNPELTGNALFAGNTKTLTW